MFHPWGFWFDLSIGPNHFQYFSCLDLFITRLAFGTLSKKNISTLKLKTLIANWKVSLAAPSNEKYHFYTTRQMYNLWKNNFLFILVILFLGHWTLQIWWRPSLFDGNYLTFWRRKNRFKRRELICSKFLWRWRKWYGRRPKWYWVYYERSHW